MKKLAGAAKSAWNWTDDHVSATAAMVTVPAVMSSVAAMEATDWLMATLAVASGFCWSGVLLPAAVRETAALLAGGVTAICGALISIAFSQSINTPGQQDPDLAALFFSLLAAGSASLYGRHRSVVEQRAASREMAATLLRLAEKQADDTAYLRAALDSVSTQLASKYRSGAVGKRIRGRRRRATAFARD